MPSWNAIGLFCEDVRQEAQTISLIGVLPDNVQLQVIPSAFPKLAIYLRAHVDPAMDIKSISAKLRFPDGVENRLSEFDPALIKATLDGCRKSGAPIAAFIISGVAAPMPIQMAGRISIIMQIDSDEVVCGTLNIQAAPTVSAVSASLQPC